MKLISLENCGDDNVLTIEKNFTATLSANCFVTTNGCITSKGFKEAKVCDECIIYLLNFEISDYLQVKYNIMKDGNELLR